MIKCEVRSQPKPGGEFDCATNFSLIIKHQRKGKKASAHSRNQELLASIRFFKKSPLASIICRHDLIVCESRRVCTDNPFHSVETEIFYSLRFLFYWIYQSLCTTMMMLKWWWINEGTRLYTRYVVEYQLSLLTPLFSHSLECSEFNESVWGDNWMHCRGPESERRVNWNGQIGPEQHKTYISFFTTAQTICFHL